MDGFTLDTNVVGKIKEFTFDAAVSGVVTGFALFTKESAVAKSDVFKSLAVFALAGCVEGMPEVFEVAAAGRMMSVADVAGAVEVIRMESRFRGARS